MANLLDRSSLVLTPTAYNNGEALCIKPDDGSGDFQFSRNSAATRVNAQGLVENVQILSSNLVQNGDFSEEGAEEVSNGSFSQEGVELVTNGSFDSDSGWNKQTSNWTISNGYAVCDGLQTTNSSLFQDLAVVNGNSYRIDFTITDSANDLNLILGATTIGQYGAGTHSIYITKDANASARIFFQATASNGFQGSIDNVSVREVGQDWTFTSGASLTDLGAKITHTPTAGQITQANTLVVGKQYKFTYEITESVSGGLKLNSSDVNTMVTSVGVHTIYFKANQGTLAIARTNPSDNDVTITNISVKEVGQDWTFQSKWSIGNGFAQLISNDSTGSSLIPNTVVIIGNKYKCSFDVVINSGSCKLQGSSGTTYQTIDETKTYNFNFIADSGDIYFNRLSSVSDITITNISVIEITDDTNLPRIDYSPYSGTGTCGHWLFEPQSTNLLPYSEDFSQYAIGNYPVVNGGFLAPDGTNNAYKITNNGSSTLYLAGLTNLNSTSTRTIYAKTVSGTGTATLMSYFGNTNNLFTLTDQWQRFELNALTTLTGENNFYAVDFRGTGTLNEILIWGANATNDQDYATSYIPTSGSTVTRNQEAAFGSGNSSLINSTEGVLYAEIAALTQSPSGRRDIALSDGTSGGNIVRIHYLNTVDNTIRVQVRSGGSITASVSTAVTDIRDFHKIAISYKVNEVKFYIDGVLINTDTNAAMPIGLNQLSFSDGNGTQNEFFGKTKCVAVFKEALTDDELECLTSDETSFSSFNALALANNYTII